MSPHVEEHNEPTRAQRRVEGGAALRRNRFQLRLERGSGPRKEVVSSDERVVLGRSPQADLVIDSNAVSRIHCEVVWEGDGFVLRDLGSRNGTWLAGIRTREIYLPSAARIGIGDAEVAFSVIDAIEEVSLHPEGRFGRLIGESTAIRAVFARLARMVGRDTTLLLQGERGTGKELAAAAVHEAGNRRDGPFVVVDCGSIPHALLEAELFGAYSGAVQTRVGAFERASGGTIFLDEVGELGLDIQPRLLRVLENNEVMPVGAKQPIPVDVRIVAATNRDLRREVNKGTFREDLYYRLAVACVHIPPLRDRMSDVPLLIRNFLDRHSEREGVEYPLEGIVSRLMQRPWPGNVRELRNAVEQIVAFGIEELPLLECGDKAGAVASPFKIAKARIVERFERDYLVSVLAQHAGNITAAATFSGLDRVHFLRLLDRHGLRPNRVRSV